MASSARTHVLIFGATSAIATEAAALWAARGARLVLVGRNEEKLAALAARLGDAVAARFVADFADTGGSAALVTRCVAAVPQVDVAFVAHGDLGDQLESERAFDEAERILQVNLASVVALLVPLANHLEEARRGRLAVITSVAGDRGRPRNYTYGAAKGALNVYLEGLRSRLVPAGVRVTTLKLGPVDTPMTVGHEKNVLFGAAPAVARGILRAIEAGTAEAYVPWFWRLIMPIVRHAPEPVFQRLRFLSGR